MSECKLQCPKCGHVSHVDLCDAVELVSYCGTDGSEPETYWCDDCDHEFQVVEHVTRWWEVIDD